MLTGLCVWMVHCRSSASSSSASHSGSRRSVSAWPSTKSERFARVMLTFTRRGSLTKPMPRQLSRPWSERTADMMITSFSRPWKPSTLPTSSAAARSSPKASASSRRMWRT